MRIEKNYIDYGFGFPIHIDEVQIKEWGNEQFPLIDNGFLEYFALRSLAFLPARLTGNQVRFIRHHFQEPLEQFAAKAGVRHTAVMKWEQTGDDLTNMAWGTEFLIRHRALSEVAIDREEIGQFDANFPVPPQGVHPSLHVSRACPEIHESIFLPSLDDDLVSNTEPSCYEETHEYDGLGIEEGSDALSNAA